ncbi:MAG: hypothetical protein PHE68_02690 [Candidatus Peribacteraceae bacterium]|nr:hypothetical protein [Candidatus Peribacteraceae bacterium]MDD5075044.1 hypothetical protein [Candidatus Peribacteraceae bacterium]
MKKFLLSAGATFSLLCLAPAAYASQNYTYDCTCLYASPNGSCMEYTCDGYQRRSTYRNDYCDYRYNYNCNDSYYNNYNNDYYYDNYDDGYRSNYDYGRYNNTYRSSSWSIRRTTSRSPYRRYLDPYYDDQMYYY